MTTRPQHRSAALVRGGTAALLVAALLCLLTPTPTWAAAPTDPDGATDLALPQPRAFLAAEGPGQPGGADVQAVCVLLRQQGWNFPMTLPPRMGLIVAEERRADGSLEVRGGSSFAQMPDGDYVHLGYSDGVSVLSVFIQRGQLDAARLTNWHVVERNGHTIWVQGSGGTNAIWSSGDYVYTVLADAPADVVDAAVDALPHEPEPGFWQRLNRGMDRVLAWANPFD